MITISLNNGRSGEKPDKFLAEIIETQINWDDGVLAILYRFSIIISDQNFEGSAWGEIAAFKRVDIAAAGLRHSRAPFPPERDCAESQSQQRDFARDPSFFGNVL